MKFDSRTLTYNRLDTSFGHNWQHNSEKFTVPDVYRTMLIDSALEIGQSSQMHSLPKDRPHCSPIALLHNDPVAPRIIK
jgi:hypothetical protein